MAAPPVTDDERARIIELLEAGNSQHATGKIVGRSTSTVHKIAKDAGIEAADRARVLTANANETRRAYGAERRALYAARLQAAAEAMLDDLDKPVIVYNFGGRDNTYNEHTLPRPDIAGRRSLIAASAEASRQVLAIDKHDNRDEGDLAAVDAWLRDIVHGGTE